VEAINGSAIRDRESYMDTSNYFRFQTNPEESLLIRSISQKCLAFRVEAFDADRFQGFVVENFRPLDIADANGYVIEHRDRPREIQPGMMGFAPLNPSYALTKWINYTRSSLRMYRI
jgi:hypothetical protein